MGTMMIPSNDRTDILSAPHGTTAISSSRLRRRRVAARQCCPLNTSVILLLVTTWTLTLCTMVTANPQGNSRYVRTQAFQRNPLEVKVMSMNVYGPYAEDNPQKRWEARKYGIAYYIWSQEPDFVGTQEAHPYMIRDIISILNAKRPGAYCFYGKGREDPETSETNAIIYRCDKWEISKDAQDTFHLPRKSKHPRICTYAAFRSLLPDMSGKRIIHMNTHLDFEDDVNAQAAAKIIDTTYWLEDRMQLRGKPFFVTGDFNAVEGSKTLSTFKNGGFSESLRTKHPGASDTATYGSFSRPNGEGKIDYVLARNAVDIAAAFVVREPVDGKNFYPSDHVPVVAKFVI